MEIFTYIEVPNEKINTEILFIEYNKMPKLLPESLHFTGTQINYYFICKRKLWLFSHNLEMEQSSDAVLLGKILQETTYKRQQKEILIDERIRIDFIDNEGVIHEVKKSRKVEEAHTWQLLYYLFYLKQKGIEQLRGEINYPLLKQILKVELTTEKETELQEILGKMREIVNSEFPPEKQDIRFCRKCSYLELCWS